MSKKPTNKILIIFIGFFGTFCLYGLYKSVKDIKSLNSQRVMTMRANKLIKNEKTNYALITAIASSHKTTAFEHANQTSGFHHAFEIDKNMQSNWYNYSFDGQSVWDRNRQSVNFFELKNMYDKVFYWSTRGQLKLTDDGSSNISSSIPPRSQFKVVLGRSKTWRKYLNDRDWQEFLGELEGYEIFSLTNPSNNKADYGEKKITLKSNCNKAKYCYFLEPNEKTNHNLNSLALWFKDELSVKHSKEFERINRIEKLWKLQGLNESGNWENLVFKFDDTLIARDSRWVFSVDSKKSYRNFRFFADEPDDLLTELRLYAKYKEFQEVRVIPNSVYIANDESMTRLIKSDFWESLGPFPLSLKKKINNVENIISYTIGSGKYGKDSIDRMPTSWVLLGLTNRKSIILIDKQNDVSKWSANEKRTYIIDIKLPIEELILTVEKPLNSKVVRISHFEINRDPQLSQKTNSSPILTDNYIQEPFFWEKAIGFPILFEKEIKSDFQIKSYSIGTASHGLNGIDSTNRMPLSWKVYGKSNLSDWILMDSQIDVQKWSPNETRFFNLENVPKNISKFKLQIEKTADPNIVRISNFSLLSKSQKLNSNEIPINKESIRQAWFPSDFLEEANLSFPISLEMYLNNPEKITSYELVASKYGIASTNRMPKSWRFQGYDIINKKWIDLHSVENCSEWEINGKRKFNFSNSQIYSIYRFQITEIMNNGNVIRLGSINLFKNK